jgi:hypothetical protein
MTPVRKIEIRRQKSRARAKEILKTIASGKEYIAEDYIELYSEYVSNPAALEEIKPLFRIDRIDPVGSFSVDDYFNTTIKTLAADILSKLPY